MSKKRAKLPGADVLFGNSPTTKEQKEQDVLILNNQDVKTLKHQEDKTSKDYEVKTEKQQPIKTVKKQNIMATVYFSPETIKEIEKARVKLLTDYDLKANKSRMVEVAVKNVIQDLDLLAQLLTT